MENQTEAAAPDKKTERNAFIEFFRFLFALWIVWYHGFIPKGALQGTGILSGGWLAVEFFFLLSGFLFVPFYNKFKDEPKFKGLCKFTVKKCASLGLIFVIAFAFAVWYCIYDEGFSWLSVVSVFFIGWSPFYGFLWYIPRLILTYILLYVLCRLCKNNKKILVPLLAAIALLCYTLWFTVFPEDGYMRGFSGIAFGVLLSFIPELNLKYKRFHFNRLFFILSAGAAAVLLFVPKNIYLQAAIIPCFASLIYFGFQVDIPQTSPLFFIRNGMLYLGSLSWGLYALQCVIRVPEQIYGLTDDFMLFILLLTLTVLANTKSLTLLFAKRKKQRPPQQIRTRKKPLFYQIQKYF
jgi:peptidoglycan/LPS O-acetylase OafA/YrhL